MITPPFDPAVYVDTPEKLQQMMERLSRQPLIALDTESNSLYAYRGQICLIQITIREQDYILDPLVVRDISPLGQVLKNPRIEKVFHAAEYDLVLLKRDFGFEVNNLFDTMMAARVCGQESVGLNTLLKKHFDVRSDKRHQLDDWGVRPLPHDSLMYAQMDTHYLLDLRDIQFKMLKKAGQLEEADEVFADVTRVSVVIPKHFDPNGYWDIGYPHHLTRKQMAVLREVYLLRDKIAREIDIPTFKVIHNKALVSIAKRMPQSKTQLRRIDGIGSEIYHAYANAILNAIKQGQSNRLPKPPPRNTPDPIVADRYVALHAWRKERAIQRGVESNIVLAKDTLWQIAYVLPDSLDTLELIDGIGTWRLEQYGSEILDVLATFQNGKL